MVFFFFFCIFNTFIEAYMTYYKIHPFKYAEWFLVNLYACMLGHCSHVLLIVTPRTVARQTPLSMEFSRQEYWSELPCPSPGDLPNLGIELCLRQGANSLTLSHQGSPNLYRDTLSPHSKFRNFLPLPNFYSVPFCQFLFPPLVPSKHWSLHFLEIWYKLNSTLYNILCLNSFTWCVL